MGDGEGLGLGGGGLGGEGDGEVVGRVVGFRRGRDADLESSCVLVP